MFIQEAEITTHMDSKLLSIDGYDLFYEPPKSDQKARIAVYIKKNLDCKVTTWSDVDLIKVDIGNMDIFGLYRPFKIRNEMSSIQVSGL